jgi:hypothetical protein
MGKRDLHTHQYHSHTKDVTPFCGYFHLTVMEIQVVLPIVLGLVLVGEVADKRGSLLVPDFGLAVFGNEADI